MLYRVNWSEEHKKYFDYEGFVTEHSQTFFSKDYCANYKVCLFVSRAWHDNGNKHYTITVMLCEYNGNALEKCYCLIMADTIAEAWQFIKTLQLDSTQSAIQCARNPWLPTLTKAVEQGKLWIEQNNQVFTFEPDYDELVIEIWSQYRLNNGALTTMSYCANIWEDELPINIRKAVFGV